MINHYLLLDALEFYTHEGFSYIEVPWLVSEEAIKATVPEDASIEDNALYGKFLVASAEQSFLQLMLDGELSAGKYCTVTPCFRNEPVDDLHQKTFMKVELIHILEQDDVALLELGEMINIAKDFFLQYVQDVEVVETLAHRCQINFDIETKGIELGSYGIRSYKNFRWVYATGVAEPRLSTVISV